MELRILGPLQVLADGRELDLGAPRQRALLAILALHVNEVVSLDRLIDLLWGDAAPNAAIGSIQAYVSNLRRILEPGRAARQPAEVLVTQPPGYVLRVEREAVDAIRFEHLASHGRALLAAGDPAEALEQLSAGLELWRGEALADFRHEHFALGEVARLDELRLSALEDRLEAQLRTGDHAAAVPALERLVARHPLREHLRALQMQALYGSGRQADALRTYEAARRALTEGLGVVPGPELQAVYHQILRHDEALSAEGPRARSSERAPSGGEAPARETAAAAEHPGRSFVGRAGALRTLTDALATAIGHRPGLALIGGEPGIGKTRLAEELAERAQAEGATVVWGRSHEGGMPPLWPWTGVVRALSGDARGSGALLEMLGLGDEPGDPAESELLRFQIYDGVRAVVEEHGRRGPLVVVLDDLQWADAASLRLLRYLAVEIASGGVLMMCLFHEPDDPSSVLAETLGDLARRPGVVRLSLDGLAVTEVTEIVRLETRVALDEAESIAEALHARTGGNPFFVTELVRLMASEQGLLASVGSDIPLVVSDVVRRRLRRLPEDLQAVLGVASVVGIDVELDVLRRAAGLTADEAFELLEVAVMARLMVETGPGSLRFSHGLVRDALYQELSAGRRERLHARVGEAIEAAHGRRPQDHVGSLLHHFTAGGDQVRVARYAQLAAEEAERASSFDQAVGYWRQALGALGELEAGRPPQEAAAERARLLLRLAAAHRGAGEAAASADQHDRALEAAEAADDLGLLAEAALAYGEVGLWQVRPYGAVDERVVRAIGRALDAAPAADDALRARLLTGLAVALYYREADRSRSRDLARLGVDAARRSGDAHVLVQALVELLVMLEGDEEHDESRRLVDELDGVLGSVEAELSFDLAATARMRIARLRFCRGEGTRTSHDIRAIAERAREARHHVTRLWTTWAEVGISFLEGRLDDAEHLAGAAYDLHQELGLWGAAETYGMHMILIWREQDRLHEVGPLVEPLLDASQHPGAQKLRGVFLLDRGATEEIGRLLGPDPLPVARDFTWLAEVCVTAELCAATGDACRERLYATLAALEPRVVTMDGTWVCYGATTHYLGLLARSLGRRADAAAHLEDAVRLHDRVGAVPWSIRSRLHLAGVAHPDRREEVLHTALAMASTHGLPRLQRELQQARDDDPRRGR